MRVLRKLAQALRPSLWDGSAAALVIVAIALPNRAVRVAEGLPSDPERRGEASTIVADPRWPLARAQALLFRNPEDADALDTITETLSDQGHHDIALRIAGTIAQRDAPNSWRAQLALASVHTDRVEIHDAHKHARAALELCGQQTKNCRDDQRIRLQLFADELAAGVQAMAQGADPRLDPIGFRRQVASIHRMAGMRATPTPEKPQPTIQTPAQ